MNNKGFTTIEVILSFALLVIIMGTLTGITISYRDKLTNSEIFFAFFQIICKVFKFFFPYFLTLICFNYVYFTSSIYLFINIIFTKSCC